MKLIKIAYDHYVIVDDSEIKVNDWYLGKDNKPHHADHDGLASLVSAIKLKKITHSTHPLEYSVKIGRYWNMVQPISLSEVKELIGQVNVEKRAEKYHWKTDYQGAFISGYNQAHEDNKEKLYTEDDMKYIFECGRNYQNNAEITFKMSMEHLQKSKNEWDVEFIDDKLKLK